MGFIRVKFEEDEEEEAKTITLGGKGIPKPKKAGKKQFVVEWTEELGFKETPFRNEIYQPVAKYIAGYEKEKEKLNLFILHNQRACLIMGEQGIGKTTLLKWLDEQLSLHKSKLLNYLLKGPDFSSEKLFFEAISEKKKNIEIGMDDYIRALQAALEKRRLVLLIDDLSNISKTNYTALNRIFSQIPTQLVVTCEKEQQVPFEDSGESKERLKIILKGIDTDEAAKMIEKRMEKVGSAGIWPLDRKALSKIVEDAKSNPKRILELSEKFCIEAAVKQVKREKPEEKTEKKVASDEDLRFEMEKQEEEAKKILRPLTEAERSKEYRITAVDHHSGSSTVIIDSKDKDVQKGKYVIKPVNK